MKDLKRLIKTTIREFLNENHLISENPLLFVFDNKNNIIAYNIPNDDVKQLNKYLYDEYGKNRGGHGTQVEDGIYYKFDSLKSAQEWYNQKRNKNLIKKTQNKKYEDLSNIALNIRKLKSINFQDINRGSCFKFAKEVSKLGYKRFTFIFSEEDQEIIHVYIKLNNNLYWDAIGFHSKNDVIEEYEIGDNYVMFDSDLSELDRYCNIDTYQSLTTIPINDTEWSEILTIINSTKK
jgi:hypothetical protein